MSRTTRVFNGRGREVTVVVPEADRFFPEPVSRTQSFPYDSRTFVTANGHGPVLLETWAATKNSPAVVRVQAIYNDGQLASVGSNRGGAHLGWGAMELCQQETMTARDLAPVAEVLALMAQVILLAELEAGSPGGSAGLR